MNFKCIFRGNILIGALEESIRRHVSSPNKERQFVAVELGTYCGYSSILMGKAMYKAKQQYIQLETNMEFFTKSSSENPLVAKVMKDLEKQKKIIDGLEKKLKAFKRL